MRINNIKSYTPSFDARLRIYASTAESRAQIFTLGMLMSNFWIYDARYTFSRIKGNNVFDTVEINTKDDRSYIVETILKNNNIKYEKLSD